MKDIVSFSRILARPTNTCGCYILEVLQASDGQSLWMLLNTLLFRQTDFKDRGCSAKCQECSCKYECPAVFSTGSMFL